MTRVRQGSLPDTPTPTEIIEALEWTGFFVFNETPIQLVAERWEALSGVELEIDPRLEDATLTGPIERVRPLEALHTIASALGAQVVQMDDGYLLAAR